MKKIKFCLLILLILLLCIALTGCGKKDPSEYKEADAIKFLDTYSVNAYPVTDKTGYDQFEFNLKNKFTLKSSVDNSWTFYLNKHTDLEFTVYPYSGEYSIGYSLQTDYMKKSIDYFYDKFITAKGNNYKFDISKSTSTSCEYTNRDELKEQAQFFLDYLDYLSNQDVNLYIAMFHFEEPQKEYPNSSRRISVYIGESNNKLVPVSVLGKRIQGDFVNELLNLEKEELEKEDW